MASEACPRSTRASARSRSRSALPKSERSSPTISQVYRSRARMVPIHGPRTKAGRVIRRSLPDRATARSRSHRCGLVSARRRRRRSCGAQATHRGSRRCSRALPTGGPAGASCDSQERCAYLRPGDGRGSPLPDDGAGRGREPPRDSGAKRADGRRAGRRHRQPDRERPGPRFSAFMRQLAIEAIAMSRLLSSSFASQSTSRPSWTQTGWSAARRSTLFEKAPTSSHCSHRCGGAPTRSGASTPPRFNRARRSSRTDPLLRPLHRASWLPSRPLRPTVRRASRRPPSRSARGRRPLRPPPPALPARARRAP